MQINKTPFILSKVAKFGATVQKVRAKFFTNTLGIVAAQKNNGKRRSKMESQTYFRSEAIV